MRNLLIYQQSTWRFQGNGFQETPEAFPRFLPPFREERGNGATVAIFGGVL